MANSVDPVGALSSLIWDCTVCQGLQMYYLSRVMRKPMFWFPTRSDTNQAVQPQEMARDLNIRI